MNEQQKNFDKDDNESFHSDRFATCEIIVESVGKPLKGSGEISLMLISIGMMTILSSNDGLLLTWPLLSDITEV